MRAMFFRKKIIKIRTVSIDSMGHADCGTDPSATWLKVQKSISIKDIKINIYDEVYQAGQCGTCRKIDRGQSGLGTTLAIKDPIRDPPES